jgi:putative ATP-dependent endonuclease of OLD family
MYIKKLSLINYRNFSNTKLLFSQGINTIIGENASGKTNLFRSIRLLLDGSMPRSSMNLDEKDFHRGLGNWRGHWIIISIEFDDISHDEAIQALFLHGMGVLNVDVVDKASYSLFFRPKDTVRIDLAQLNNGDVEGLQTILGNIEIDDYETYVTGKSSADFNDPEVYKRIVGDFENVQFPDELNPEEIGGKVPPILSMNKEVSFTYVQALRDVVSDFQNNRTNPLRRLLKMQSGGIDQTQFAPIVEQVQSLNGAIEALQDVQTIRNDIKNTINETVGDAYSPNSISIKSGLPDKEDELFQALKLFVAETDDGHEGQIHEMSLGGANLIYLTLKLLGFKYQKSNQTIANFLLIEEPEAHIHTHIQKSLFDKLKYPNTQVIYTTHSSHISEVSNIENVNVLGKINGSYTAFQPSAGLTDTQIERVQRYLDAVRSNLLFAKSVILVEGDAEEILIPILTKQVLGISLDELGISLVNIRSTGFENVALLFNENRIKKRCSIITDNDMAYFDTTEQEADSDGLASAKRKALRSQVSGIARKTALDVFCNGNRWVSSYFAPHTFEVDFIAAGNGTLTSTISRDVYLDAGTINIAETELKSPEKPIYGKRVLTMANHSGKGWFAILLGKVISHKVVIPSYIIDAIFFAHGNVSLETIHGILQYRLRKIIDDLNQQEAMVTSTQDQAAQWYSDWGVYIVTRRTAITAFKAELQAYLSGTVSLQQLQASMTEKFQEDQIIPFFARF